MKQLLGVALWALTALVLPVSSTFAAAPDTAIYAGWTKPGPPPLERFIEPLKITPSQRPKLEPIFQDAQIKASQDKDGKQNHAPNPHADGSALAARETEFRERLATVLTAGQFTLYERISDAHFARLRAKNPALPVFGSQAKPQPAPGAAP